MAQQRRALVTKPDDLGSVPTIHTVERELVLQVVLQPPREPVTCKHTHPMNQ